MTDILYVSSSSFYGNSSENSFNERTSTPRPISLYGATKLSNEMIASCASRETGIRTRGLRFFIVYGPWGRPDMVYFRIGASILNGKEFKLNVDGSLLRDFTYIDDVVKSVLLLERQLRFKPIGFADVVNIGGVKWVSIIEVIKNFEFVTGNSANYLETPSDKRDVAFTCADFTHLSQLTDYAHKVDVASGIRSFVEWASIEPIRSSMNGWIDSVKE